MPKRFVVCCDGTWNRTETVGPHVHYPTNVLKTARAVAPRDEHDTPQFVVYVPGIGTHDDVDRYVGGVTGRGLNDNIEWAYLGIAHNYEPKDEIFMFGFSRGGFTARSLSGFLHHIGIMPKNTLDTFPAQFVRYQTTSRWENVTRREEGFRQQANDLRVPDHLRRIPIRFIGVWDTVAEVDDEDFHQVQLTSTVTHAYHALALHEFRARFTPVLWSYVYVHQHMEQVWFPGAHSDVGGGLAEPGLSVGPLLWMMEHAAAAGLAFDLKLVNGLYVVQDDLSVRIQAPTLGYKAAGGFRVRAIGQSKVPVVDDQKRVIAKLPPISELQHSNVPEREGLGIVDGSNLREAVTLGRFRSRIKEANSRAKPLATAKPATLLPGTAPNKFAEAQRQELEAVSRQLSKQRQKLDPNGPLRD